MSYKNPEAFNEIICVAPADGKDQSNMTDCIFEAIPKSDKFPVVNGCFEYC